MRKKKKLLRFLFTIAATMLLILPLSSGITVHGFDSYEVDEGNYLTLEVEQGVAAPGVYYCYQTYGWWIFPDEIEWNSKLSNKAYWTTNGFQILDSTAAPVASTPPDSDGTFTEYYLVPAEKLLEGMQTKLKISRKQMIEGPVTVYASRALQNVIGGDVKSPVYWNYNDFKKSIPLAGGWPDGTMNILSRGQNKKMTLTFQSTGFTIMVVEEGTGEAPEGYSGGYDMDKIEEVVDNKVLYGDTISPIDYPGEIDGYRYVGYEWNYVGENQIYKAGSSTGKTTKPYTVSKFGLRGDYIEDKGIILTFKYQEVDGYDEYDPNPVPTSVPVVATPKPTEAPTPTPVGGITVTFDPDGGYVSPESKVVVYGEAYGQLPTPSKNGYELIGWFYSYKGNNPDIGGYPMVTKNDKVLVDADHTLIAMWNKSATPAEPTSTPTPQPTPISSQERYYENYRYYTTDKGYTLDAIANNSNNKLAGYSTSLSSEWKADDTDGGSVTTAEQTKRNMSYSIGADTEGNEWYFIAEGTSATYVHPKSYQINGVTYSAINEEVKNITELVFPSSITSGGTAYTVVSIGGGGAKYHEIDSDYTSDEDYYYEPAYGWYEYRETDDNYYQDVSHKVAYMYGVLGNGYITSSAEAERDYDSYYKNYIGASEYHVYNTTLKRVVIPSTVKSILSGAFINCQALTSVEGCMGVTFIGEDAFSVPYSTISKVSPAVGNYYNASGVKIISDITYYYNEDFNRTAKTDIMLNWEEVSALADYMKLVELKKVQTVESYAFHYRKNMFHVVLGNNVKKIYPNAFKGCKLDSITLSGASAEILSAVRTPDYDTLGTKGLVENPTLIYTTGDSVAIIRYGVKWKGYYKLVCGYDVIYSPNGGRQSATGLMEDYVTKTEVASTIPKVVKTERLPLATGQTVPIVYDENNTVWYYMEDMLQKLDLSSHGITDIVSIEDDHRNKGRYYIETSAGDVWYAVMNITYEQVKVDAVRKLFNIRQYRDAGTECGYNCIEKPSGGANYGAYYATGSTTASKKYSVATISYDSSDDIIRVNWNYQSSVDLRKESSGSTGTTGSYWTPVVETEINGTKVEFTAESPSGTVKTSTYTGTGDNYTGVEYIDSFKADAAITSIGGNTYNFYNYKLYALKKADGIRSVVLLGCTRTNNNYTFGFGDGHSVELSAPLEWLRLLATERMDKNSSGGNGARVYRYYLGKGTDGRWYRLTVCEEFTYFSGQYAGGNYLDVTLSGEFCTLPSGLTDISDIRYTPERTVVLAPDGTVWTGNALNSLTKQTLPEKITGMRKYDSLVVLTGEGGAIYAVGPKEGIGEKFGLTEDLTKVTALLHLSDGIDNWDYIESYGVYIKDNILYRLSDRRFILELDSDYTIYEDLIVSGGKLYSMKTGLYIMDAGADFSYRTALTDICLNNGILYYRDTFGEVPAVSDTYKFVAVMEDGDIMEREGHDFRFWYTLPDITTDEGGTIYYPGDTIPLASALKVYAQWKEKNNIIRYHANGGMGTMADTVLPYGVTSSYLRENTFIRTGYTFAGWATSPTGAKVFNDKAYVNGVHGIANLYAKWKEIVTTYELVYMKYPFGTSGNTVWKTKTLKYNDSTVIEGKPYTPAGCTVSYQKNKQDGMSTTPEDIVTTDANTKTAPPEFDRWRLYTIIDGEQTYAGRTYKEGATTSRLTKEDGGKVYLYPSWGGPDSSVTLPDAFCDGYYLLGWSESKDGSLGIHYPALNSAEGGTFTPVKNTTLYAQWTPAKKTIPLNAESDGKAPDKQEQTEVIFTFDAEAPEVEVPVLDRYVFMGYYTELAADGTPAEGSRLIYDKHGKALEEDGTTIITNDVNGTFTDIDELYAYWVPDKAIVYNPNYEPLEEDCPTMETTWIEAGETGAALTKNVFTKTGYHFVSWNTEPDGSGTSYEDEAYIENVAGRITLYAQWEANTYIVQYAPDGIEEEPPLPSPEPEDIWSYEKAYVIKGQPYEKYDLVSYDLNRAEKSTVPELLTELTDGHTKSVYRFIGWQLYEKTASGYVKQEESLFTEGQSVTGLTKEEGKAYVLFPVWEAVPDGVELPVAGCTGYDFHGWTETKTADSTIGTGTVLKSPYVTKRTAGGSYLYIEENGYKHKCLAVTLYAYWTPKQYTVTLDKRGGKGGTDTVIVTFDERYGGTVEPPEKRGYEFKGYYSVVRGYSQGLEECRYFDDNGNCVKAPGADDKGELITVLYASWLQNEVELPKEDDYTEPTPEPTVTVSGNIGRTDGTGLLYADDYNSATGALTDLQPYLTYDTPGAEGVIPGTELLSFRARMGAWMLNYKFRLKSGTERVRIYVTVPYVTQYECFADEELVVSEPQVTTIPVEVEKAWSYWEVAEGGMYYPDSITVENEALLGGSITVPVDRSSADAVETPSYSVERPGGKTAHIHWEEKDADGIPVLRIELEEEEYIISDVPDTPPDVLQHLDIVCKNAARADERQAKVRSDSFVFDGETVLSGDYYEGGCGAAPDKSKLPENAEEVELTSYVQTYRSGIELDESKPNGAYSTEAYVTYTGDDSNIGTSETKTVELRNINNIKIHTPAACRGVVVDGISEEAGEQVIVLKDALNFFTLRVDNTGTHRMSLGYGTKDFSTALSGKSNIAMQDGSLLNQVQCSFDVYVDVGNDTLLADGTWDTTGDYYVEAGTWMTIGSTEQRFYVPVTQKNGTFQIDFRTVAVNCPMNEDGMNIPEGNAQNSVNTKPQNYVAADSMTVSIRSLLTDFRITGTNDSEAQKQLENGNQALKLKKGYAFSFELSSQGEFYGENSEAKIVPSYFVTALDGTGRKKVTLYEVEKEPGCIDRECYPWKNEPMLEQFACRNVILQNWKGSVHIPADIRCVAVDTMQGYCKECKKMSYVAMGETACEICQGTLQEMQPFLLEEYAKNHTLTGNEPFFLRKGILLVQFDIRVRSEEGRWYTFNSWNATELAQDFLAAGWNYKPGDTICYDLSKSVADDYEIGGIE